MYPRRGRWWTSARCRTSSNRSSGHPWTQSCHSPWRHRFGRCHTLDLPGAPNKYCIFKQIPNILQMLDFPMGKYTQGRKLFREFTFFSLGIIFWIPGCAYFPRYLRAGTFYFVCHLQHFAAGTFHFACYAQHFRARTVNVACYFAAFYSWNFPFCMLFAAFWSWNPAFCLPVGYVHIFATFWSWKFPFGMLFPSCCWLLIVNSCLLVVGSCLLQL